jgi:hypothetical protein
VPSLAMSHATLRITPRRSRYFRRHVSTLLTASGATHRASSSNPCDAAPNCAPNISPIAGLYRATATEPKEKGDDQEGHDKGAVRAELQCSNRSRNVQ